MLSLTQGTKIAMINKDPKKCIYIKEDSKDIEAEIETSEEKKLEIFERYIEKDKKLLQSQINELIEAYKTKSKPSSKLERKFEQAIKFVNNSLKFYLDFPKTTELIPIMPSWYTMFVSGTTGAGKSYYLAELVKYNKPKFIFIMSPVKDDPAFKKMKPEPIYIDLNSYYNEYEKLFEIEDIPPNSLLILDDIDTDKNAKEYQTIKVQALERARHIPFSVIVVSHNPLGGNVKHAKAQTLECHYYVVFPKANKTHAENFLSRYVTGRDKEKLEELMNIDTRGLLIKKTYPSYYLGQHTVGVL
jgi:hypothetical protein